MADGSSSGGPASSSSSTLLSGGGRLRFEVELTPGETTIVSWKKLMKDANKAAKKSTETDVAAANPVPAASVPVAPVPSVAVSANPALDSRISPTSGKIAENEGNDAPPGSRFSAVIEKIERLYMGKNSSDEEDLNDVPDDDEYDTDDSFIDDAELDDYFQVDNSAIKHDGFFVNRGKLERINEPTALPSEQPKKRRRKDSTKGDNGSKDGHVQNKQMKVSKSEKKKMLTSADKNLTTPSRSLTVTTASNEMYQNTVIALGTVVKKSSDSKSITNPSPTKMLDGETKVTAKNIDNMQKTGVLQSKKHGSKTKDGSRIPVSQSQRTNDKSSDVKSQGPLLHNSEELNQSALLIREKNIVHPQADIKASEIAQTQQPATHMVRKEGSSTKPKSTNLLLEKAIRDLEKTAAEVRPPSIEVAENENSSQAVKRPRMPPEIKQKLAKVARLTHSIHGKHTKELLNRLMSILGHWIQIRSLKRNLQNMVDMGVSANEEKAGKLKQLKREVDEMVKMRAPLMKLEAVEQQAGSSDDFQEPSTKEKVVKCTYKTDDVLEDKLCDLYDCFVDGLDEDAGPQVRKLYAELAELFPKGCMDNHGIKRAICRAKDRRKALHGHKDQEKMKRKKIVPTKTETVTIDTGSTGQVQHTPVKVDSSAPVKSMPSTTAAANITTARPLGSATDKPKQDKPKGNVNIQSTTVSEAVKKIAKKKPETKLHDGQSQLPEKSNIALAKQMVVKAAAQPPSPAASAPDGGQPKVVSSSVDMV
ncbi:ubinuclein-1-like isoform X2 [Bidens hawaiensis]|uniref:ubinuclein-1-like isoform X2 n=1 Tax=Bidens hawaiensis TaxID=980011 RepID=UPI00404A19B3